LRKVFITMDLPLDFGCKLFITSRLPPNSSF
jgi:hypothetical protein